LARQQTKTEAAGRRRQDARACELGRAADCEFPRSTVQVSWRVNKPKLKQQVDDGKMRVLANWGAQRIASFPDLPTFRELGYQDVEFYIWAGLFAPSALPAPIMTRLREAMALAVKSPEVITPLETAGSPVAYLDAPEFSKFVAQDSARLIAAVKKIGRVE
jgi:tripartite-type tricarboxylate transporter receptor subunit TctC